MNETVIYEKIVKQIAEEICDQAYWYEDRCNWTGIFYNSHIANAEKILRALPINFYEGSAGIAFFLSASYNYFGLEIFKKTSIGAWQKTKGQFLNFNKDKIGFHEGLAGIAYGMVQSGKWLNDTQLVDEGLELIKSLFQNIENATFDIMTGCSGYIVSLSAIEKITKDKSLINLIKQSGNYLLHSGVIFNNQISWPDKIAGKPQLTGYSLGISGVIHALSEVYYYTKDAETLNSIKMAIEYENSFLEKKLNNWQDLRLISGKKYISKKSLYGSIFWCHGAIGISLSRLRSFQITNDYDSYGDAIIGINAINTKKKLETKTHTLCHGVVGDLYAIESFNKQKNIPLDFDNFLINNKQITEAVVENKLLDYKDYLLKNPSLFLGKAGIAYYYLSLLDQKMPNIFVPGL